jgi:starch phosphorylase
MMKEAMKMAIMDYSSDRMVREYSTRYYVPASRNFSQLTGDSAWKAKELAPQSASYPFGGISGCQHRNSPQNPISQWVIPQDNHPDFLGRVDSEEFEVQIYHGKYDLQK